MAATVEAPVIGSDGIVESRTAEWLFGAIRVTKSSICLHLGADAFVNASPIFRSGRFASPVADCEQDPAPPLHGPGDFVIAPMIFKAMLESDAIHIRRNTPPMNSSTDLSRIEKRLRMIVDPKGYLAKDRFRMSAAAMAEIVKGVVVLTIMGA